MITLTKKQLEILKCFISKKGIKESDVVNEILDHFACKTEEIMNADSSVTFDMAMKTAHLSFGKIGFRPIVAQYEKHLEKVAWQDFKLSVKEIIFSPTILFAIAASALFVAVLNEAPMYLKTHWLFGVKAWTLLFCFISFMLIRGVFIKKHFGFFPLKISKLSLWQQKALMAPSYSFTIINIALISSPATGKEPSIYELLFCSFIAFLSIISSVAQFPVFRKMSKRFYLKPVTN